MPSLELPLKCWQEVGSVILYLCVINASRGRVGWVTLASLVLNHEVEASKEGGPSGLPPIKLLNLHEALEISVVDKHTNRIRCAFEVLPPLLESTYDC